MEKLYKVIVNDFKDNIKLETTGSWKEIKEQILKFEPNVDAIKVEKYCYVSREKELVFKVYALHCKYKRPLSEKDMFSMLHNDEILGFPN